MKQLALGILVGVVFIYASIYGVSFDRVVAGLRNADYIFLVPTVFLLFAITVLRSIRLRTVLYPLKKIPQERIYSINCVGYMAVVLVPIRIGELFRSYLLSDKTDIPLSSVLAAVFIERLLDLIVLTAIVFFAVFNSEFPIWVVRSGYVFLAVFVVLLFLMYVFYYRTDSSMKIILSLLNFLPQRVRVRIERLTRTFIEGLAVISSPKKFGLSFILSILIWVGAGLTIYSLFFFYGFKLSIVNALVVMVITIIGVSLPAVPASLGNFQLGCIVALSIFGVSKSDALSFSIVYYVLSMGVLMSLGLIFLPSMRLSWKEIKQDMDKIKKAH